MRFLLYGINFSPELTGIGKYTGEMAQWLVEHGHDVDVITAPPYYPEWKVANGYSKIKYSVEGKWVKARELRIIRCPLWVPNRVTGVTRMLHLLSFAASSSFALLFALLRRPEVVVVVVPTMACVPLALLYCFLMRARAWIHVQDFELDAAFEMGIIKKGIVSRLLFSMESILLRRFDRVSSISPRMIDRLESKGVDRGHLVLFQNWVDLEFIYPMSVVSVYRQEWGVDEHSLVVLYSGNMGEKQGLEIAIDAARRLQAHHGLVFFFVGAGAARAKIEKMSYGLSNVRFYPLQPFERLNELLNLADIHLLPQRADAADLVMPSKLTGILASGRAVIGTAARDTQLGEVLDEVGVRVEPGDSVGLCDAITRLAEDKSLRQDCGIRGRVYAEKFLGREAIMDQFVSDVISI